MIFLLLSQCNKNSISQTQINQCDDIICSEVLNDFMLKITVSAAPYDNDMLDVVVDSENYLGVLSLATDGYDSNYDILEPLNNPGNWISLYFPHSDWEHPLGDNFTKDIKGNTFADKDNKIVQWDFNVEANIFGTINLNFEALNQYCYDCINFIELAIDDDVYISDGMNFNNINISRFLQQNQILSFNLTIDFN